MRVVVLDYAASSGGALSILKDFYSYLVEKRDNNDWFFLVSEDGLSDTENIHILIKPKKNWIDRMKYELWDGRKDIVKLQPDIVLSLQNTMPRGISAKKYLYIHQTIPFQKEKKFSFFRKNERIYAIYQYLIGTMIKESAKRADKIFVQTEWLRGELWKICGKNKLIEICTPTIEKIQFERGVFSNKYFIYPAAPIIYKNHKIIYEACQILRERGITDFRVEFTCTGENVLNIYYIGSIDRKELFKKYTEGTLLFPSYIESYGYPLAEARMQNTIVLAADCGFSHEVLYGYENAYFFPYNEAQKLADLMQDVIEGRIYPQKTVTDKKQDEQNWERILVELKREDSKNEGIIHN